MKKKIEEISNRLDPDKYKCPHCKKWKFSEKMFFNLYVHEPFNYKMCCISCYKVIEEILIKKWSKEKVDI